MHILDLNVFAASKGYPQCVPEERVVVNAGSGIVYLPEDDHAPGFPDRPFDWSAHHKFGTHAAPWYLAQVSTCSCTCEVNCCCIPCLGCTGWSGQLGLPELCNTLPQQLQPRTH